MDSNLQAQRQGAHHSDTEDDSWDGTPPSSNSSDSPAIFHDHSYHGNDDHVDCSAPDNHDDCSYQGNDDHDSPDISDDDNQDADSYPGSDYNIVWSGTAACHCIVNFTTANFTAVLHHSS